MGLNTISFQQLWEYQTPGWLIEGLLRRRTLGVLAAEPYTGKTLLTLHMVLAMELKRPVLERFHVPKAATSLIFSLDPPKWDIAGQYRKLARGFGLDAAPNLASDIFSGSKFNVTDARMVQELIDYLTWAVHGTSTPLDDDGPLEEPPVKKRKPIDVIFFDTLLNVHYQDENDNRVMGMVMDILKEIRRKTGCALISTHHTPVVATPGRTFAARGAGVIVGGMDYVYELTKRRGGLQFEIKKGRGSKAVAPVIFEIKDVPHADPEGALRLTSADIFDPRDLIMSWLPARRVELVLKAQNSESFAHIPPSKRMRLLDNTLQGLRRAGAVRNVDGLWAVGGNDGGVHDAEAAGHPEGSEWGHADHQGGEAV